MYNRKGKKSSHEMKTRGTISDWENRKAVNS